MIQEFTCIVCEKKTIAPRAHITTHTVDEIITTFTRLTVMQKTTPLLTNKEERITESTKKPPKQQSNQEKLKSEFADLANFVKP